MKIEKKTILYLAFDGVLKPLGYSQVIRTLRRLSAQGLHYILLSMEKPENLACLEQVEFIKQQLHNTDIEWIAIPYDTPSSAQAAVRNLTRAFLHSLKIVIRDHICLIHARSQPPLL